VVWPSPEQKKIIIKKWQDRFDVLPLGVAEPPPRAKRAKIDLKFFYFLFIKGWPATPLFFVFFSKFFNIYIFNFIIF